jgi:hypothetical protein
MLPTTVARDSSVLPVHPGRRTLNLPEAVTRCALVCAARALEDWYRPPRLRRP